MVRPRLIVAIAGLWLLSFLVAFFWTRRAKKGGDYHRDVVALGALLALTAGFFWRPLFSEAVWIPRGGGDFASFYYPLYSFAAKSIRNGVFPLWNPYLYSGMPFAADIQTGVFYPLNLLTYLLVPSFSYQTLEWLAIAHYFLAGAFAYAFLRVLGLSRPSSLASALVYAFSGFLVTHLGHLPMVFVAAWLPLILLFLHLAMRRSSIACGVLAGVFLGVAFLAGHIQIFLYIVVAVVLYWLFLAFQSRPATVSASLPKPSPAAWLGAAVDSPTVRHWLKSGAILGAVLVAGLGLAAVQFWPTFELGSHSVRAAISYEESTTFGVSPVGLSQLFLPHLWGDNPTNYWGPWSNTEVMGYAGVFTLILGTIGVVLRGSKPRVFFLGLAALGLLLSLSGFTILHGWFYQFVPGFSKMRAAGRTLVLFDLGAAVLAGYGLEGILRHVRGESDEQSRRTLRFVTLGLAGALAVLVLVIIPVFYSSMLSNPNLPDRLVIAVENLNFLALLLIAGLGILAAAYWRRLTPHLLTAAVLSLVVLDLFSAGAAFNPSTEDTTKGFQHDEALAVLREDKDFYRIDSETGVLGLWQPSFGSVYQLFDVSGLYNPLKLADYSVFWELAKAHRDSALYDFLNVKYLVTPQDKPPSSKKFALAYQDQQGFSIYQNKEFTPRAFVVYQSEVKANQGEVLAGLQKGGFDPRSKVLLEEGKALSGSTPTPTPARITSYTPDRIKISVDTAQESYLVLSEVFYPGWHARVDGQEVPILRADYAFRAVLLPAGSYTVEFVFDPGSWQVGRAISFTIGGAIVIFFAALGVRRYALKRKANPSSSAALQP